MDNHDCGLNQVASKQVLQFSLNSRLILLEFDTNPYSIFRSFTNHQLVIIMIIFTVSLIIPKSLIIQIIQGLVY